MRHYNEAFVETFLMSIRYICLLVQHHFCQKVVVMYNNKVTGDEGS